MGTWKLTVAYDGTRFSGWARQPGARTVQQVLEEGVGQILGGEPVALVCAGRTDAGVHALGQVASFSIEREVPDRLATRLNAVLPRDLSVLAAEPAPDGFDARRWAISRRYRYRLLVTEHRTPFEEKRALWWPYRLDREALDACAAALIGEHDFTAFTPTQTEHVRFERVVASAVWVEECEASYLTRCRTATREAGGKGVLVFDITADAFMRSMIRVLVGTMLEVAGNKRTVDDFVTLLDGAPRERAGETAAPHGLYFSGVTYGDGPAFSYED